MTQEGETMLETILAVLLRLTFLIVAFGLLTTFFLLRVLIRKTRAVVTRLASRWRPSPQP